MSNIPGSLDFKTLYTVNPSDDTNVQKLVIDQSHYQELTLATKQVVSNMLAVVSNTDQQAKITIEKPRIPRPKIMLSEQQTRPKGLTALIGTLMQIISATSTDKLKNRLMQFNALSQAKAAVSDNLSKEFKQAVEQGKVAITNAENAHKDVLSAENKVSETTSVLEALEKKLSGLSPSDSVFNQAKQAVAQALIEKNSLSAALGKAKINFIDTAEFAAKISKITDEIFSRVLKNSNIDTPEMGEVTQNHFTGLAAMTLLMGQLALLIGDNADRKLQDNAELTRLLQEARQAEMQVKAKEQADAIIKAEQLSKTMGCVGKILGGLIVAVSLVGAIFTGGASLALAAVGIALMVADPIVKAITGKSITDRVMAPVLEHVIQPMMKFIANAVNKFLKDFGVDESISNIISTVVSAITIAITMIAVSLLAKAGGKALLKSIMPMINKMISKLTPTVVKNSSQLMMGSIRTSITRLGNSLGIEGSKLTMKQIGTRINYAALGGQVVRTGVESSNEIFAGLATKDIAVKESEILIAMADVKAMSKYLKQAFEIFTADIKAKLEIINQMVNVNINSQQTNFFILNTQRI